MNIYVYICNIIYIRKKVTVILFTNRFSANIVYEQ